MLMSSGMCSSSEIVLNGGKQLNCKCYMTCRMKLMQIFQPPKSWNIPEREIKQESPSVHIPSPVIPTVRKQQKVTVEDVLDDDEVQYLGQRRA